MASGRVFWGPGHEPKDVAHNQQNSARHFMDVKRGVKMCRKAIPIDVSGVMMNGDIQYNKRFGILDSRYLNMMCKYQISIY